MIAAADLADRLNAASCAVRTQGPLTWERLEDWHTPGRLPTHGTRGGGMAEGADDDERLLDRKDDIAASRYWDEMRTLTRRLEADLARLNTILGIANPERPRTVASRDMQLAQVEAEGWCGSCWRNDQNLTAVTMQKSRNGAEVPKYRGRCEWCGKHRKATGEDPPIEYLRARHEGRRVRVKA